MTMLTHRHVAHDSPHERTAPRENLRFQISGLRSASLPEVAPRRTRVGARPLVSALPCIF